MKKQLLLGFIPLLSRKTLFRLTFFTLLSLLSTQTSFAQQWTILGNENQISSAATSYTSITVLDNVPYIAYVEGTASGGIGKVKRKNASTGVWEQVGGNLSSTNISYTKIYSNKNNKLYVTYIDNANSKLAILTFNTNTQAWEPLISGNPYISSGSATYTAAISTTRSGLAFDNNNIPYVTFSERTSTTGYPYVKRFVSGAWETVGGTNISADWAAGNSIALDNNNIPYLVYIQQALSTSTSGILKTFRFNSNTNAWENISPPTPVSPGSATTGATAAVRHTNIAMDDSYNPVVSYFNTSNSNKSTVIRYNKTTSTWNWTGAISTRDANNNSLINDNDGNVYNMFSDALISSGLSNMVRVFKLNKSTVAFTELKNETLSRGIDSTGVNSTTARSISIGNLSIAVGSDTSKPFIVYTKTNSNNINTPIVQFFSRLVYTKAITDITANSATAGGETISDGASTITERGIVYGTNVNPTISDTKIAYTSGGIGSFTIALTGLIPATGYHVRAYSISSTGAINYGNDVILETPTPDPTSVTAIDNGSTVILNNGIVKATINKSNGTVTSLIYNGLEMIKGGYNGGSIYWSWNMPNYQQPTGCTYTLVTDPHSNNFDFAEIKLHMTWDGTTSSAAMDVDVYYSLPRNASGIYASATLSHPATYPANPGGEWRMASYPNPRFDWLSVDALRNRIIANGSDWSNAVSVSGAPPEVKLLTTGIYKDQYECKYDYSADFGAIDTWGWSSTADNVGLWVTAPSKEYYPGGPMKRELMCHSTPVLLNMLGGTHYGMGDETAVAAGEDWQKTYGPFLIYCNKVAAGTTNAPIALWEDAKAQAKTEQAAWPYNWHNDPAYIQESGRGTVTGKLVINSATNSAVSAADTWIGLAIPPTGSGSTTDFQNWSKNYQFWVKTDANGNFTIPHVLPGTYSLFAFGPGAAGQLSLSNYATVSAGNTTTLGTVSWTPTRVAPTVWEIGTPDRNATEYKHGSDWWTSNRLPSTNWAKFMDYTSEFPNDVNFTIGQSNIATDWNFVQPYTKSVQSTSPKWNVNFNLSAAPVTGSTASVYAALAENMSAALILSVNGTNVTIPTTGLTLSNGKSNAMIRKGIHGAYSDVRFDFPASYLKAGTNQISFTLRITGGGTFGDVMYDYIRLEASIPPNFTTSPSNISTNTTATSCDTVIDYLAEATGYTPPVYTYTFTGATTASGTGTGTGSIFNKGITHVTIAATNSGGTTNHSFDVTVNDTTKPAITAPEDITIGTNNNCTAKNIDLGKPTVTDNCNNTANLNVTNNAPAEFPQGATVVTWTVKDEAGNTETATQTVTVTDNQNPTITAPADVSVNTDAEICTATNVVLGTPETTDNCVVASVINDAPTSFPIGTTTVKWTVKDAQGNTAMALQSVTVKDTQAPVLTTPAAQVLCYNETYNIPALVANDNCGIASVTYAITGATEKSGSGTDASGSFNVGVSTIIWTVTDVNDNQTIDNTTVTVNAPLAVSIPDVYALNQSIDLVNTLYHGYGPTFLTLNATAQGGTAPYTYHWNTGAATSSINVNSAGTYTVTITDAKDCSSKTSIVINLLDVSCGKNNDKVMICHNGVPICVASSAVQEHLNHGCKLGSCVKTAKITTASSELDKPTVSIIPEVLVYPNPSAGQFTVQFSGYKSSNATVIITNTAGQIVAQKEVKIIDGTQTIAFNISNQAQDIYLLKVLSADGVKTLKIVLKK